MDRQVDRDDGDARALVDQAGDSEPDRLHVRLAFPDLVDRVDDRVEQRRLVEVVDDPVGAPAYAEVLVDRPGEQLRAAEVDPDHLAPVPSHFRHYKKLRGRDGAPSPTRTTPAALELSVLFPR